MLRQQTGWLIATLILASSGIGCSHSDNSDDEEESTPEGPLRLDSFTLDGTSEPFPPLLSGRQPIDPSENGGQFSVSWSVSESPVYYANLYVSKDSVPHNGDEIRFFRITCGDAAQACSQTGNFVCKFDSNNLISCNNGQTYDLTVWFDQLPQDAFVIFEATTRNAAVGESVPVQFR